MYYMHTRGMGTPRATLLTLLDVIQPVQAVQHFILIAVTDRTNCTFSTQSRLLIVTAY